MWATYMCPSSTAAVVLRVGADVIELPVRSDVAAEILLRARDAYGAIGPERLGEALAYALLGRLISMVDTGAHPPSVAQINFALDIARQLGVALPIGALQDRVVMGNFLTLYGDQLRRGFRLRTPPEIVEEDGTIRRGSGAYSPNSPE
jgi:hypothetical protein